MAGNTTRYSLPYPTGTDAADQGDDQIKALAEAADSKFAGFSLGLLSARPTVGGTTGPSGFIYYATDNGLFYVSDGSSWVIVNPKDAAAGTASLRTLGTGANQAAPGPNAFIAGDLKPAAYSSAPTGWLTCDGSAVSRTTYSGLYTAIGTLYGAGDGSTTFNVPDLRGRVAVGADGSANRLSANDTLGNSGGEEAHTLSIAEMPSHDHKWGDDINGIGRNLVIWGTSGANIAAGSTYTMEIAVGGTSATGGGGSHNNMQPYQIVNWFIKT